MTFKKILTFTQTKQDNTDNDIMRDMNNSISFIQTSYCHPTPSEYFESIDVKVSDDKLYSEIYINFPSSETYSDWFGVYGDITEELYLEIQEEFKPLGIKIERFFDSVEHSRCYDAQPIENFVSKFS
jgi:hypothetical protein